MLTTIFILLILSLAAFKYCGWPSVSVIYNTVWLFSFTFIFLGGSGFLPVNAKLVYCIITIGVLIIIIDLITKGIKFKKPLSKMKFHIHLKIITVILLCLFPFFIRYLFATSDIGINGNLLFRIRYATTQVGGRLGIVGVIALFATFHAVTCLLYREHIGKYWVGLALLTAITMQILTAARTGLIVFICASFIIVWFKDRKLNIFTTLFTSALIILSFLATSSLRTADLQLNAVGGSDLFEKMYSLFSGLSLYIGSGPVALSQIVESRSNIVSDGYLWSNFFSSIGLIAKIDSGILPYVYVPMATNIYSMFFPYYLYGGWTLVMVAMIIIASVLSVLFRLAVIGGEVSAFVYAFGAAFLIQSPIGDGFIVGFPIWVQMFLYVALVYLLIPTLLTQMKRR